MSFRLRIAISTCVFLSLALFAVYSPLALAQTTISTGSIQGTVTDQSGAVVRDARVTITNKGTRQTLMVTTTSAGTYASGALIPGDYTLRVEAKGFNTTEVQVTVQVN